MKNRILGYFLVTIFTLIFSPVLVAQENLSPKLPEDLYTIELIIFKYNQMDDANTEFWKAPKPLSLANALEINSTPSLFTLNNEKNKIANNEKYTLILHRAWKQKLTASDKPIHIRGGDRYDYRGNGYTELDGTISVSKNKFIKITTNLFLTEPTYGIAHITNGLASYPMQNSRNTKEKELNYFDNPAFGMLIKVSPT